MAKTDGFSEYSCDVQTCTAHDYAQPDTDKADEYAVRKRYDDNGVLHELMLCAEHTTTYGKLVSACEQAYIAFEHDGSYELATKEEVAELEAALAAKTAEYEAVRKNRDTWVTKYNQLNAEFEEYKRTHPDTAGDE